MSIREAIWNAQRLSSIRLSSSPSSDWAFGAAFSAELETACAGRRGRTCGHRDQDFVERCVGFAKRQNVCVADVPVKMDERIAPAHPNAFDERVVDDHPQPGVERLVGRLLGLAGDRERPLQEGDVGEWDGVPPVIHLDDGLDVELIV